jgi:hypothetical protein
MRVSKRELRMLKKALAGVIKVVDSKRPFNYTRPYDPEFLKWATKEAKANYFG